MENICKNCADEYICPNSKSGNGCEFFKEVENLNLSEEELNETYKLSERSYFSLSLFDAGITLGYENEYELFDNRKVNTAWKLFENRMKKYGYYVEDDSESNIPDDAPSPEDVFIKSLKDAKIEATESEMDTAYELFIIGLTEADYIRKKTEKDGE